MTQTQLGTLHTAAVQPLDEGVEVQAQAAQERQNGLWIGRGGEGEEGKGEGEGQRDKGGRVKTGMDAVCGAPGGSGARTSLELHGTPTES